jgi:phage-related protein
MYKPYALPSGYNWDLNQFVKQVKTKKWVITHASKLGNTASKLTSVDCDKVQIIGGMLQNAYGVNIGQQIEAKLKTNEIDKIADNILNVVYS